MMLPTHAVVGLAMATPLYVLAPDHAPVALGGALIGSVVPDLDMYAGHRRSLHYPTVYILAAVPAVVAAGLLGEPLLITLAFVLMSAALHCQMDRYGGGLELRPWEGTSDRAVYDHMRGRWRTPKRWIRYDGAPEDVLLMVLVGIPLIVVLDRPFQEVAAATLLIGFIYGVLRRRLAVLAPLIAEKVPEPVAGHVPDRYRQ